MYERDYMDIDEFCVDEAHRRQGVASEMIAFIRAYAKENGMKAGQIFHPVRVAVSGRTHGPTLFKMLECMGKETVLTRLLSAQKYCK